MITSASNRHVKQVIQLQKKGKNRKELDCFIAEGIRMAAEAPPDQILQIYLSASFYEAQGIPAFAAGRPTEIVADHLFVQMSDTKTPQGILCLIRRQHYTQEDLLAKQEPLLLLLEDLQDPGNVGTIFRTAEGAGADGIIMTKKCVDLFHPKTIRSTMGSVFRVPYLFVEDPQEILAGMTEHGVRIYAAHLAGEHTYDREDYRSGTAFLIGNEGNGLSNALSAEAHCRIRIPMEGRLESLNAAVSAALLLYEAHRQRAANACTGTLQ